MASVASGVALADPLKLFNIPITRVENYCASGMDAFRNACMAVAAGMYDVVLALGFEKLRDSGQRGLGAAASHPHPVIGYGTTAPTLFALAANRYYQDLRHRKGRAGQGGDEEPPHTAP
jgi:acetyl-CoA C-acetyltransferase